MNLSVPFSSNENLNHSQIEWKKLHYVENLLKHDFHFVKIE